MKEAIVSSAKEVCGCAKVGSKNANSEWWNEEVIQAVKSKKEAWLNVLKANDEVSKERCLELYKEEKRNAKRCTRKRKEEVNEQFGRRMNGDIQGNRTVSYTHLRAHETPEHLVCRLLLEKKKNKNTKHENIL